MVAVNKKPESKKEAFQMIVRNICESIKEDIIQANEVKFKLNFNYKSVTMYFFYIKILRKE